MAFFRRIKRGAERVKEYKEKLEKWQDEREEKLAERAKKQAARFESQAKRERARASLEEARARYQKARGSSGFGFGSMPRAFGDMGIVDTGFRQPQHTTQRRQSKKPTKYYVSAGKAYPIQQETKKPKKRHTRRKVRHVQAPQPKGIRGLDYM